MLTRRDDVGLSWSAQLGTRTSANLSFSAIRSKEVLPELGFNLSDVRYLRVGAGVTTRFGEQWSISLGGAGSRQDFYQLSRKASGFEARLAINWSIRPHVL